MPGTYYALAPFLLLNDTRRPIGSPGANMRVTDLLRTMDIFETLQAEELETITQLLRERRLAESEVLCRQGDPGDALFIVTGGRIRLSTTDPSGNEKILTYFTDGQFFG